MAVKITWRQALAWRMRRQLLDPVGRLPVARVVRRLCAVQAQVASSAELAVRVRRAASQRGEVSRALSEGRLIKTWAMRGAWELNRDLVRVTWFREAGRMPRHALGAEVERLSSILDRDLSFKVALA